MPKKLKRKQNMSDLMTLDQCLAFNGDFKTIRVHKATQQASVIDLIRLITGGSSKRASEALKNIQESMSEKIGQLRINGQGRETPVADARTCVEIIWELPGKAAKEFRRTSAHYITRILGGDPSLIVEMEQRHATVSPEQQDFMLGERRVDLKRKRDEMELETFRQECAFKIEKMKIDAAAKIEHERLESQARIDQMKKEDERKHLESQARIDKMKKESDHIDFMHEREDVEKRIQIAESGIRLANDAFGGDAHMKAAFKDFIMVNVRTRANESCELSLLEYAPDISQIAARLGYKCVNNTALSQIGKALAKKYREEKGEEPEMTEKYVNGSMRSVKTYKKCDVPMIESVIHETLQANVAKKTR
jgi:hypothetical protein